MKTKEVERKDLVIGNEYYDTSIDGEKLIYVGIFMAEEGRKCRFFYPIEETGYDMDSDGTIPFGINGGPFCEEITE